MGGGHSNLLMASLLSFPRLPPAHPARDFHSDLSRGQSRSSELSRPPTQNNSDPFLLTSNVLRHVILNPPFQRFLSLQCLPQRHLHFIATLDRVVALQDTHRTAFPLVLAVGIPDSYFNLL